MILYAIIDTNIIVSSMLKVDSIPRKIINLISLGIITPLLNEEVLNEYIDVINRDKFPFNKIDIKNIIDLFNNRSLFIKPKLYKDNLIDESDRAFYEVMLATKDEYNSYLITGNIKHFPKDERVLTPREFLEKFSII